ncbi:DUF748 domain-containing protein [Peredibacter starrii]|uniref:DUF748 domain-containing protein n=1 Tax=Peredibacter starrii TaxID=28202 RepID=A0AAX4HLD9_9BACT|nr:DUF748 domain-containing protein [Peredibacter starrii]WPU64107.1 DUF748 domain-containing protein [Peredibacter starrii]
MRFFFHRPKPFYKRTWFFIVFLILGFMVALRMILPSLMVAVANNRLKKESPNFSFHIDDIDLAIIKGKYTIEGITGTMKSNGQQFMSISSVNADVPWKNIFDGKIITDIVVNRMNVTASQKLIDTAKKEKTRIKELLAEKKKEDKDKDEDDKKKESRLNVKVFKLNDSNITIQDLLSFKGKETRTISNINVIASNLTPSDKNPVTNFVMTADVFGPAPLKVGGIATLKTEPLQWDVNSELKKFDLRTLNPLVREKVKAYIHKGKLDLYAEAKSQMGKIEGYVKPFVSKFKMDTPEGGFDFKGSAAKEGGNLVKLLLTDSEAKTLATVFPFTFTNKMKYEIIPPLKKAVEHKAKQNIKPGIENRIQLEDGEAHHGIREAQEEKPKK